MATIKRFEDLEIWQLARSICIEINILVKTVPIKKDYDLVDQIRRSSGSAMDNIAEGFEREGRNEFIHFLSIAKGSAGETRSQLYRALDHNYIDEPKFQDLNKKLIHLSVQIRNLMTHLKRSDFRGMKFC